MQWYLPRLLLNMLLTDTKYTMSQNSVDILENNLQSDILKLLLHDHTTGRNIFWATHDYEHLGKGYQYADEIRHKYITGNNGQIVKPRVLKTKEQQSDRVKDMAEVFTPSWVVKMMVDNVDFDIETRCMELTCGEAPFIVSRYDTTTGEPIAISERIGILDRKLRMVNDQQLSDEDWLAQVRLAFQTTYGYEWQGDSLLLARENQLYTFIEYYESRFGSKPDIPLLQDFAEIISWNLWQMDGLTYRTPSEKSDELLQTQFSLFDEVPAVASAPLCVIMDWQKGKRFKVNDMKKRQTKDIMKFDVIIGNPPYQEESVGEQKNMQPSVYHYFIEESYKLSDIVELIHPARFLSNAGNTPKDWNKKMLEDTHFKVLSYEADSKKIFPNTDIKGGIAISYRDRNKQYEAIGVFTAFEELNAILQKTKSHPAFSSLMPIVVTRTAYRLTTKLHKDYPEAITQLSNGHAYDMSTNIFERLPQVFFEEKPDDGLEYAKILGLIKNQRVYRFIRREYINHVQNFEKYKIILPKANGSGAIGEVLSTPLIGTPLIGNTESFISIGSFNTRQEAEAAFKYIKSKFARCLLGVLKITQDNPPDKWRFVPLQDFTTSSDIDWSKSVAEIDEQLFDKYGLDEQERNFIRTKVKEMA